MKSILRMTAVCGLLAFALSGCATITEGKTDQFAVTSVPVDGAKCELKNGVGTWYVTTPGSADVHKSKTDLEVNCTRDGYQSAHQTVESHFEGMTAGNILIGGVIGIGVDAASGAMNHYPKGVEMTLIPNGAPPAAQSSTAPLDAPRAPDGAPKTTS